MESPTDSPRRKCYRNTQSIANLAITVPEHFLATSPPSGSEDFPMESPSTVKTPVPENRGGMEMDSSPPSAPTPPRSPWKKARVLQGAPIERLTDAMWTSGELFNFEQNASGSEGGRLSLGMLDLSGNSEPNFNTSDVSQEDRSDASTLSPGRSSHSHASAFDRSNMGMSPEGPFQSRVCRPGNSPNRTLLNNSGSSVNNSSLMSNMPTIAQHFRKNNSPNRYASPLNPQRLFAGGVGQGPVVQEPALSGAEGDLPHLPSTIPRRMSAPPEPSPVLQRRNPFLGAPSHVDQDRGLGPLTTRSFTQDFCDFKEIGKGSFGKVYSCTRKLDLCRYAVKEIRMKRKTENSREQLLKEIYALATQGDNIHVVRYYNAWEEDGTLYIQTELCSRSLAAVRRQEGPQMEHDLYRILTQVGCGLAFMHAHKIAHLDVKPDNIYTTDRGIYKLGDFGLASQFREGDAGWHEEEGDKRYLSREMLQHELCDLFKADIFALGVSIYELASPEPLPTEGEGYHALRDGTAPFPSSLAESFQSLLRALLHIDPNHRPSAAQLVQHPMLFPLLKNKSAACLQVIPPPSELQIDRRILLERDAGGESVVKVRSKALKAEKEVARLQAALSAAQNEIYQVTEKAERAGKEVTRLHSLLSASQHEIRLLQAKQQAHAFPGDENQFANQAAPFGGRKFN